MGATQYARTTDIDSERGIRIITKVHGKFTTAIIEVPPIEGEDRFFLPKVKEEVREDEKIIKAGIYSGFAFTHQRSYDYIDGPPPIPKQLIYRLHNFNPTQACREAYPDDFVPSKTYQPITRLSLTSDYNVRNNDDSNHDEGYIDKWRFDYAGGTVCQTNLIHPCQYSGPLARACSLALGNGTFNLLTADEREALLPEETGASFRSTVRSVGYRVQYGWNYWFNDTCMQDNLGNWWLITTTLADSRAGVYARPMPIITAVDEPSDPIEKAAVAEFGGIPTGESITSTWTAQDEVDEGNWLLLLDRTDSNFSRMYYDEEYLDHGQCWVYNDTGTEGRMCTYQYTPENFMEWTYWSLTFEITTDPNTGESTGSATLVPIEQGIVATGASYNRGTDYYGYSGAPAFPFSTFQPGYNKWFSPRMPSSGYSESNILNIIPAETEATIWVGWIDGGWHEVKFKSTRVTRYSSPSITPRTWPNTRYGDTGYRLALDHAGNEIGMSEPEEIFHFPTSPLISRTTEIWTVGEHGWSRIDSNTPINTDTYFLEQWYEIRQWKTINEIYASSEGRGTPQEHDIYCVQVPYNRNAYFIYHYDYDSGGGSRGETISAMHIQYLPTLDIGYSAAGSPEYTCDLPPGTYPYPYVNPTPYPAHTVPICVSPGGDWSGSCPGASSYMSNVLEAYFLAKPNCYDTNPSDSGCEDTVEYKCANELYNRWHRTYQRYRASGYISGYVDGCQVSSTAEFYTPSNDDPTVNPLGGGCHTILDCGEPQSREEIEGLYAASCPSNYYWQRQFSDYFEHLEYESITVELVADGLPGSSHRFIGPANPDDDGFFWVYHAPSSTSSATSCWWCQTAVLGAKAAIYSDPTDVIYTTDQFPYVYYPIVTEGTHPALPTEIPGDIADAVWEGNDPYRWLTFVGVNGP